jgi:hypothetical protein
MVNENYGRPRVRMRARSDGRDYRIVANPKANRLRKGHTVVVNYAGETARAECPVGLIDAIRGDHALVFWERGEMETGWYELGYLRRVKVS